jgi:TetR/AcrR family transcriptional regulator, cholesterol catabolism regulator
MEAQEKILKTALTQFFKYGIRHVTMDEIARELGMSKKTIYQYYKEKDDLVNQLLDIELREQECQFESLNKVAKDAVHEMFLISARMRQLMQSINPMFFLDLQKFYPSGFARFQKFKEDCGYQNVLRNMKKGQEEGYYREDLDLEFAARYRMAQLDMIMFGGYFSFERTSPARTHELVLEMFMYGICNLKGHKLINHYKNQKDVEQNTK